MLRLRSSWSQLIRPFSRQSLAFTNPSSILFRIASNFNVRRLYSTEQKPDDTPGEELLLTTRNQIEGRIIIEEFGIVVGAAARSRNIIQDIISRINGIFGGRLVLYESMLSNTTAVATRNAMYQAKVTMEI